jgi:hypothetical protein
MNIGVVRYPAALRRANLFLLGKLADAFLAHQFFLEQTNVSGIVTEYACGVVLFHDDFVAFREDFQRVVDGDIIRLAQLYRNDDPTQIV